MNDERVIVVSEMLEQVSWAAEEAGGTTGRKKTAPRESSSEDDDYDFQR